MRVKNTRIKASVLASVMVLTGLPIGTVAAPVAGITDYTAAVISTVSTPTAGVSLAMSEYMNNSEGAAVIASTEPKVKKNETPVVASEYADIAVAQVTNYVNIRKRPNEESKVVGKLYANCVGNVLKTVDGWCKIKSGNVVGFVSSEFVKVGDEDLARSVGRRTATVTTETLKVRADASKDSEVIGLVPGGDDLTVVDESEKGWVGVSIEEGTGYVSADYVKLSTEYNYAESKEEEEARLKKEEEERLAAIEAAEAAAAAERAASQSSSSSSSSNSSSSSSSKSYKKPSGSSGQSVANYACQFVGNPYVYGGSSLTNGTDCSGFIMSVYNAFGVSLPHSSASLRSVGYGVSTSEMQAGDIVCYSGHVAMYIGNNTIVHASNKRDGIKYTSPVNYRRILAVRRIF